MTDIVERLNTAREKVEEEIAQNILVGAYNYVYNQAAKLGLELSRSSSVQSPLSSDKVGRYNSYVRALYDIQAHAYDKLGTPRHILTLMARRSRESEVSVDRPMVRIAQG